MPTITEHFSISTELIPAKLFRDLVQRKTRNGKWHTCPKKGRGYVTDDEQKLGCNHSTCKKCD
jgi:hypothetical protein